MRKVLCFLSTTMFLFFLTGCELQQDTGNDSDIEIGDAAAIIASSYSTASYDDLAAMEEAVNRYQKGDCDQTCDQDCDCDCDQTCDKDCDCTCDQTCDKDCDCDCDQTCDQDCDCDCNQTCDKDCDCTCDQTCDQDCECDCNQTCDCALHLTPYEPHYRKMYSYNRDGSAEITFTVVYFDSEGTEQDAYDSLTTEKVEWNDSFISELITPVLEKNMARTHQFIITGLAGENETIILNGTGTADTAMTLTHPLDKFVRSYHMSLSKVYSDVVWSTDRETYPCPLSGTIEMSIDMERISTTDDSTVEKTFSLDAVITFNGTCCPELVINKEKTFTINITDGTAAEQ